MGAADILYVALTVETLNKLILYAQDYEQTNYPSASYISYSKYIALIFQIFNYEAIN